MDKKDKEIKELKEKIYQLEQNLAQCENGYKLELVAVNTDNALLRNENEFLKHKVEILENDLKGKNLPFLDYPEQELIWRLTSTHPYQHNYRHTHINMRYTDEEELEQYKKQILSHLKAERVVAVEDELIKVKTVFCDISELKFCKSTISKLT